MKVFKDFAQLIRMSDGTILKLINDDRKYIYFIIFIFSFLKENQHLLRDRTYSFRPKLRIVLICFTRNKKIIKCNKLLDKNI